MPGAVAGVGDARRGDGVRVIAGGLGAGRAGTGRGDVEEDRDVAAEFAGQPGMVAAGLQRTASRGTQPSIAAGICLLGINCTNHEKYLMDTLKFADKKVILPGGTKEGLKMLPEFKYATG